MDSTAGNKAEILESSLIAFEFVTNENEGVVREKQIMFVQDVLFERCQSLIRLDYYVEQILRGAR
jgi:hypothetical protein